MKIADLTYRELQSLCKSFGLPTGGRRSALEERLREHTKGDEVDTSNVQEDDEDSQPEAGEGDEAYDNMKPEDFAEDDDDDEDDEDDEVDYEDEVDYDDVEGDDGEGDEDQGEHEVLGLLVRSKRAGDGDEEGEVLFVGADELQNALGEEDEEGDEDDDEDFELIERPDDEDFDEDEEEDIASFYSGQHKRWSHISRKLANVFAVFEFALFMWLLITGHDAKLVADNINTPPSQQPRDDFKITPASTGWELLSLGLYHSVLTVAFWGSLFYYALVFIVFPALCGLVFGKYYQPESVFVYAVTRVLLYYLLLPTIRVMNWANFPFLERVFIANSAASLLFSFWEKQSTVYF